MASLPKAQLRRHHYAPWCSFKFLQGIANFLDSHSTINWYSFVQTSEVYWSLMPCCSGNSRPPVLSSYQANFLELEFLHSLWGWDAIGDLFTRISQRSPIHTVAHRALGQPYCHAYASLPHGFQRLTDKSTAEYRHLKAYLEARRDHDEERPVALLDIYRVFVKDGAPNPYKSWLESRVPSSGRCGEERRLL